jgi:hypothetical protein
MFIIHGSSSIVNYNFQIIYMNYPIGITYWCLKKINEIFEISLILFNFGKMLPNLLHQIFEKRNPNLHVLNDFLILNIKIKMIFNIFKLQMFVTFSVFFSVM